MQQNAAGGDSVNDFLCVIFCRNLALFNFYPRINRAWINIDQTAKTLIFVKIFSRMQRNAVTRRDAHRGRGAGKVLKCARATVEVYFHTRRVRDTPLPIDPPMPIWLLFAHFNYPC